ncbi:phospholipase effector Tle1 domain-containing protein [Mycobacterium sp. smrl_JER01]|uniref:phospholipase effector Tle1 domain-containing protein n=1 Tax=Mycobacterium sp. smrl_JER01 TaxID=3402633 RepID=UPI003ABEB0A6
MKNIALCFDLARSRTGLPSNTGIAAELLCRDARQLVWSPGAPSAAGRPTAAGARAAVAGAYEFLARWWEPGDRVLVFGGGHGATCAWALARLLDTFGLLVGDVPAGPATGIREYVLATYALPRTRRDGTDWARLARLAADLSGGADAGVDVDYLGLWDTAGLAGAPGTATSVPLPNVKVVRDAV